MTRPSILICTVGTSLFKSNLEALPESKGYAAWAEKAKQQGGVEPPSSEVVHALREAYTTKDPDLIADALCQLRPAAHTCGAEINSVVSMIEKEYVPDGCGLFFLHSDTPDGHNIAAILKSYFKSKGHAPVETIVITDLQDQDPKRFRTKGLRNLARAVCQVIHERSVDACAINATGGYKAQIAVGVLLGQALGIPVYYKHEMFSEIIAFPPMPVALDFELWMRASGMLNDLERSTSELIPFAVYADEWDEKYESLVERVPVCEQDYLDLSSTGQIFHAAFRERFRTARDQVLPPPVPPGQKREPNLKNNEGHMLAHREPINRYLVKLTQEVPQVALCVTRYFNPDLPERNRFRLSGGDIEGIYSDGSFTMKFRVETTAQTPGQRAAVVATLNEWLNR